MDKKKGGKGRGFERFFDKGAQRGGKSGHGKKDGQKGTPGRFGEEPPRDRFSKQDRPDVRGRSGRPDEGRGDGRAHPEAQRYTRPAPAGRGDGRAHPEAQRYTRPAPAGRGDGRAHPEAPRYTRPAPAGRGDARPEGGLGAPRPARPPARPVPPAVFVDERPRPPQQFDRARPAYGERRFGGGGQSSRAFAPPEPPQAEQPDNLIVGRNPIREALKAAQPIEKMLVAQGELSGSARELVAKAREAGIVVQFVERSRLDAVYANHQGMIAYASAANYATVDDILALADKREEPPFVIVLDGVTDPHNLGAIIRTAECCGAHGVIVPERRSAGLTPAAVKAAAGALAYLPVARVGNLSRTLSQLKQKGLWVIGCDMSGADVRTADMSGPVALVVGSEGEGISRLVLEGCDRVVSIPVKGQIASLNASVAAGIALYEIMRARGGQ
jgi:23S rRNA (guanosine2251-2'-O)-methyltransferase